MNKLEITNLVAAYGAIEALHGISLYVEKGEIVALLGANGAGKSSTLMSIMRLAPPEAPVVQSGDIRYGNKSLLNIPAHRIVSEYGIALVPEGRRIFGNLTVLENLVIATYARKDNQKVLADYDAVFALFPILKDRKNQRADTLSGGEQQMLAMGRAFMCGANFILLDEPSMGLAPLLMQELFKALKHLNENGVTLFVVEQNASIALKYAHRAYIMETGQIVLEGKGHELLNNPDVKKAYVGT
jgi:branched-chain amino acid transport system ATP-binding protein